MVLPLEWPYEGDDNVRDGLARLQGPFMFLPRVPGFPQLKGVILNRMFSRQNPGCTYTNGHDQEQLWFESVFLWLLFMFVVENRADGGSAKERLSNWLHVLVTFVFLCSFLTGTWASP